MNVSPHADFADSLIARDTASAIEACVHCGFCLATCPTYLDSRDERDSPRGRIYLIRDLLETGSANRDTQHHLDRCLTCRSCETTCPSGVQYGVIADGGRELMEQVVPRTLREQLLRGLLLSLVPRAALLGPLLGIARWTRPLLPKFLRQMLPEKQQAIAVSGDRHARQVILFDGCVQAAATPRTNQAAHAILQKISISVAPTPAQACCGALRTHLAERERGLDDMRRNIDAWWPAIESGAIAIISTATGCASQIADYAAALAADPRYAEKAAHVSKLACDLSEFLLREGLDELPLSSAAHGRRVAVQVPCSQMHALASPETVRTLLKRRGYTLTTTRDDHLCCGSAGSYSLMHPEMAARLRARKLGGLNGDTPDCIASANIGCQLHLALGSPIPVKHWAELVYESL